jgi:uncharacterized protein YjdB
MLGVRYQTHVEDIGWMDWVEDGQISGTIGRSKRIEAIRFELTGKEGLDIFLHGNAQCENIGWCGFVPENTICGTVGESRKLEGIQLQLVGSDAGDYSVQFRTHSQDNGTLDWAKDGELSGTEGAGYRAEAIQIIITKKGIDLSTELLPSFRHFDPKPAVVAAVNSDMASDHFSWSEYACDCVASKYGFGWCDGYPSTNYGEHSMSPDLIAKIEQLRVNIGKPITVSSGIRCEKCNSYWGGVSDSLHKLGEAADIYCSGLSVDQLANAALAVGLGVIRYYSSGFVHVQTYARDTVGD